MVNRFMPIQTNSFKAFVNNNLGYCINSYKIICKTYFWIISNFTDRELLNVTEWNVWKHDAFGHDVTSIELGYLLCL